MKLKFIKGYFSKGEIALWVISVSLIIISFVIFDKSNYITLTASLIGATSLIFNAKGNPIGQVLIIIFGVLYGIVSYTFAYYGEMLTYLGMTLPMAIIALIAWLKNPYNGNRAEVKVSRLKGAEIIPMSILTVAVTIVFYFVLKYFNTANLLPSTLSVTTSFIAVYLTFRRSPYFAIAYAANDIVLIVLWIMATIIDISYLSVTICFIVFLVNDIYGFINWRRMQKRQNSNQEENENV
ncbi:MAG: nicotinamide mononucleotide transporter [Clostridiales bacterium]|nr:nicotinamide mononucleotide transporter [Clostridiales bacterium]